MIDPSAWFIGYTTSRDVEGKVTFFEHMRIERGGGTEVLIVTGRDNSQTRFTRSLFHKYGYTRILGLSHIIFWTPLLAYLWKTRNANPKRKLTGLFVKIAIAIIFISLLFDYTDIIRYIMGDRATMRT